jgi:hypothetical protein
VATKKGEQKETGKQARNTLCTKDKQDFNQSKLMTSMTSISSRLGMSGSRKILSLCPFTLKVFPSESCRVTAPCEEEFRTMKGSSDLLISFPRRKSLKRSLKD